MDTDYSQLALIALSWTIYGALHSLLASNGCKHYLSMQIPLLRRGYRLAYNGLALLLLIPPLTLTYTFQGAPLWQWSGASAWLSHLSAVIAIAGFLWSLRYYDGAIFLGTRQWGSTPAQQQSAVTERFTISPLHRFVRHPWYFFALLIIWTRDMDAAFLTTATVLTLYFVVGSRMEERKLIAEYGEPYRRYRRQVPGLVPRPGRYLKHTAIADLYTTQ
ncbi:MAG: hypothetical protein GXP10_06085 [Gammaproteobacteria bacterium]|nr:hypothetical protein [Gammaproteobacteria bacterium]